MKQWMLLAAAALASSAALAKSEAPTPLFASDTPIRVTIQGPIGSLVSNRSETPRPATMTVDGVTYPITLTPRGITRKLTDTCDFPPLRVDLTQPAAKGTLFHHQHNLKLVTHCKRDSGFQQKVLTEYSAYRIYNLMTPLSFRARLATVDYVDEKGRPYISRVGYFLEDFGDVAKRNALSSAHIRTQVPISQLDPESAARVAVFEYLVSNYDWSMRAGPANEDCCHNVKLATDRPGGMLQPVPYDFDYSGLVDAPYAIQPEGLPISSVRQRLYRGYCAHLTQARAIAAQLAARRAEILGIFMTIPGMDPSQQGRSAEFLRGFFADVDSGRIFKTCVN